MLDLNTFNAATDGGLMANAKRFNGWISSWKRCATAEEGTVIFSGPALFEVLKDDDDLVSLAKAFMSLESFHIFHVMTNSLFNCVFVYFLQTKV